MNAKKKIELPWYWQPEATHQRYLKMYRDPKKRAQILAYNREWKRKNRDRLRAAEELYLKTLAGQKRRAGWLVDTPDDLFSAMKILQILRKELRNE